MKRFPTCKQTEGLSSYCLQGNLYLQGIWLDRLSTPEIFIIVSERRLSLAPSYYVLRTKKIKTLPRSKAGVKFSSPSIATVFMIWFLQFSS